MGCASSRRPDVSVAAFTPHPQDFPEKKLRISDQYGSKLKEDDAEKKIFPVSIDSEISSEAARWASESDLTIDVVAPVVDPMTERVAVELAASMMSGIFEKKMGPAFML